MKRIDRRLALVSVLALIAVGAAYAQSRVQAGRALDGNTNVYMRSQDGHYLDANPKVGSGGYNYRGGAHGAAMQRQGDILSQQYYEVTRTGRNRYNQPTRNGQSQRYRATNYHASYNYHGNSYSGGNYNRNNSGISSRQQPRIR